MGVHTGAALLLCFVVRSNCDILHVDCPLKNEIDDIRICGSDGVTYETPCDFVKFKPKWVKILHKGPCHRNSVLAPQTPPLEYVEEDDKEYQIGQMTPRYPEEDYNDYQTTSSREKEKTPIYPVEDEEDYYGYQTTRRPHKPTRPKNTEDDNKYEIDLIIDKPSINFNIHNEAQNHNNIKVGPKNRHINPKLENEAKNINNINIGRHAPFPHLYHVNIHN